MLHELSTVLLAAPALVKVLASLGLILVAYQLTRRLGASILAGTFVLGVWAGYGAGTMARIAWARASSLDTLMLLLVVVQVIWLSSQMAEAGVMQDLVDAVRARLPRRIAIAVLPATIGLLPMPGGALFSAPLVDACDVNGEIEPTLKAQTNYWFRHVWEPWWPLYPGVLLAMQITGLDVGQFMIIGIPLTLTAVTGGWLFLLRRVHPAGAGLEERPRPPEAHFLSLVMPIIVVVAGYTVVRTGHWALVQLEPGALSLNKYVPMAIGILFAMLALEYQRPIGRDRWRRIMLSRRAILLAAIVLIVRVYGAFIEPDVAGVPQLAGLMGDEMKTWGIPTFAVIMLVPFVSGLTMGLAVGFVGAGVTIAMSLLGTAPDQGTVMSTTALAYGSGFVGMMLSPVHVCHVVTNEHFRTRLRHSTAGMIGPGAAVIAVSAALYHLIGWLWT